MFYTRSHILFAAASIALIGAGAAYGQTRVRKSQPAVAALAGCVNKFDARDWTIMLKEVSTSKPDAVSKINSDREFREKQVQSLRELFAMGCQAVKDGALKDPAVARELENIRVEIVAVAYENLVNKGQKEPALSSVSDERARQFYAAAGNEAKFEQYLATKLELLKRSGSPAAQQAVSPEERAEVRLQFARISILSHEGDLKAAALDPGFAARVGLNVKLQRAQFLARLATEHLGETTAATDPEIDQFILSHPELDMASRKTKAESVLKRALAGEDFATLANTFTDDPGNLMDGKPQGGLYADVQKGKMIPEFEKTALGLKPGEVSPMLTRTDYGYHIIKLEKKTDAPDGLTYDVRHILISTGYKDPANPDGPEMPVRDFVRYRIEKQKEADVIAGIVQDNPVDVAPVPVATAKVPVKAAAKRPVRRAVRH
ncbi:MAG: peptidylprolyl isomerase [Acidobacteriota bacterium]